MMNWKEITSEFGTVQNEPDELLFAEYGGAAYRGDAYVCYRIGDKYYTVQGGHCSCYGLEGQWEPEEYTKDLFIPILKRRIESNRYYSDSPSYDKATYEHILKLVEDSK
jgi:hypothetical protein